MFKGVKNVSKLAVKFLSIQSFISFGSLLIGLSIINLLDKVDYALFTMITAYSSTLIMLTDSGISSGLNATMGRFWLNKAKVVDLFNSALLLRRKIFWWIVPAVTLILILNFYRLDISWYYTLSVWIIVLIEFNIRVPFSFTKVVIQLFENYRWIQYSELYLLIFRLVGASAVFILVQINGTFSGLAIIMYLFVLLGYFFQIKYLTHKKNQLLPPHNGENKTYKDELFVYFRNQVPNTIFYSVHSQVIIWILSILGNTNSIADIGAVGRIALLFSLILSFFQNVILPKFSKEQNVIKLKNYYIKMIFSYITFSIFVFLLSYLFKNQLIWLLGDKYSNTLSILPLMVLNTLANSFAGFLYSINVSKGWMRKGYLIILFELLSWVILYFMLDLTRIEHVIYFNLISVLVGTSANFIMTYDGLKNYNSQFLNMEPRS